MRGLSTTKIDGEYYVRFDKTIKRKRHRFFKKCESKSDAIKQKRKIEKLIESGDFHFETDDVNPPTSLTLSHYYERFAANYLQTAVRPNTRRSYELSFEKHILPALGSLQLPAISRETIKDFVAELLGKVCSPKSEKTKTDCAKSLSKSTIRIILASLSKVLSEAREDGKISVNPCGRLGAFYKTAASVHEEINPLTSKEMLLFLEAVLTVAPEYYEIFLTACHTGMRSGELRAIQWQDLDFAGHFIHVRRGVDAKGNVTETTKTGRSRRIDMSNDLESALLELKQKHSQQAQDFVFSTVSGAAIDASNLKRVFFRCLDFAELRRIRFHDLRHSFASILLSKGESIQKVKELLGHTDIRTTSNIYAHYIAGSNRDTVNLLPAAKSGIKSNVIRMKESRIG